MAFLVVRQAFRLMPGQQRILPFLVTLYPKTVDFCFRM
jgi:hypothetical protein